MVVMGLLTYLAGGGFNYGNNNLAAMRGILGQQATGNTSQAGPAIPQPGTGLLGGQMGNVEAAMRLQAIPGRTFDPMAAQLMAGQNQQNNIALQNQFQNMRPQQPTTTYRNLQAAGLQPGTQPFQQAMLEAVNKPMVRIGSEGRGSNVWTDDEKRSAGIPIENVVVDGKSGPKVLVSGEKKGASYDTLGRAETSLAAYKDMLRKTGTEYWPGKNKLAIGGLHKDMLLEMKELYNLGVLSGPDMGIMEDIMKDPTQFFSQAYSGDDLLYQIENTVEPKLKAARERLDKQYGGSKVVPTKGASKAKGAPKDGWTVKRIK